MKQKLIMLLTMILFSSACAMAQNKVTLTGDVNGDGVVDVADIVSVIDIMSNGGGTSTIGGYFYLGTTKPTTENYETITGVVKDYKSIDEAAGTTVTIDAGEILYMLCPKVWMEEKNVEMELSNGTIIHFFDEIGNLSIPEYVIYKTQSLENQTTATLRTKDNKDSGDNIEGGENVNNQDIIELPEPKHYSILNLVIPTLPIGDNDKTEGYVQYYDDHDNYIKLKCSLTIQGQTSRNFARTGGKGNYTLDLEKDVRFGSWVPQDSYHLKGSAKDVFRAILPTSYKYAYIMQTYLNAKPNRILVGESGNTETEVAGNIDNNGLSDARCLSDGFPCEIYVNGEYWGLYSLQLKKHRKNYSMDKKDYTSFFLDPDKMMTDDYKHGIWNDGVDAINTDTGKNKWWIGFNIKGPKDLVCMDGNQFDGDHPKELIDETSEFYDASNKKHQGSAQTKALIRQFSTRYNEVKSLIEGNEIEAAKAKFNEYFDYNACMLVYIFNCVMRNSDSVKKNTLWGMYKGGKIFPALWDLDGMYGQGWAGNSASGPNAYLWTDVYATAEWPLKLFWRLYSNEIKSVYADLRNNNIISMATWENVVFDQWINRIGKEAYNRDMEKWTETPSYRENLTNTQYWTELSFVFSLGSTPLWNDTKIYNQNDIVAIRAHEKTNIWMRYKAKVDNSGICPVTGFYKGFPQIGGFYDSTQRWKEWMQKQIQLCDSKLGYTK